VLTPEQIDSFREDGYIQIPNAVPKAMVDAARKAINHSIGAVGQSKDDLDNFKSGAYCDELKATSTMTDLFNRTTVMEAAEQLMGEGNVLRVSGAQMALRFPTVMDDDMPELRGHLDGMGNGKNGMAEGVYRRGFTAFAVIYLDDVLEPLSGNFTVWPKTHTFFEDYFKEHGQEVLKEGTPRVDLPEPAVQVCGKAGDAVIAHHQMIHTGGPNASPDIRYATIARLRHKDCEANGNDVYTDIWREWEGIRQGASEVLHIGPLK
jgi:hypothetical protein